MAEIHNHFKRHSPPALNEKYMWLSHEKIELDSMIPLSVNLDLFNVRIRKILDQKWQ